MRICMMAPWPSVHTTFWLKAVCALGHEVHLVHQGDIDQCELPAQVITHQITRQWPVRFTGTLSLGLELRRTLRRIRPDILHIHTVFAGRRWKELPQLLATYTFHPLVITAWGSDLRLAMGRSRSQRMLIRFAMRSADLVMAQSQELVGIATHLGAKEERVHQIQYGIDTELFCPEQDTVSLRTQLDLGAGPVVYCPRAFAPLYIEGLLATVDSIPSVLDVVPECRFLFRKRADFHVEEYETQLRRRIEALGVGHAVRILPPVQPEILPTCYAMADIVLSVTPPVGLSRSVQEAMACGAFPILGGDLALLREWVTHEENGLLINSAKPDQIADAVLSALSDPALRDRAATKNRHLIQDHFSYDFWLGRLDELYRGLL